MARKALAIALVACLATGERGEGGIWARAPGQGAGLAHWRPAARRRSCRPPSNALESRRTPAMGMGGGATLPTSHPSLTNPSSPSPPATLAQPAPAPSASNSSSKGTSALDAMLSTSKASAPDAKNKDFKEAAAAAPSSASPAPAAKQATPSSATGCTTPLAYVQNDARFKKLAQLIDATPPAARLADILDSPDVAVTLLAPTDDAVADSLGKQGLSFSDLVANPTLALMVLQFHLLPNPIPLDQFINGYSFNTLLPGDNFQDAIGVAKGGDKVKLRGPHNGATLLDTGSPACISTVYAVDGMLLPKRAIAGGGGGGAKPAAAKPAAGDAVSAGDVPAGGETAPAAAPPRRAGPVDAAAADHTTPVAKPAPRPPPPGAAREAARAAGAGADPNAPVIVDAPAAGR